MLVLELITLATSVVSAISLGAIAFSLCLMKRSQKYSMSVFRKLQKVVSVFLMQCASVTVVNERSFFFRYRSGVIVREL